MQGIAYWIEKRARINPNRIAVITEEEQLTYQEFHIRIQKAASYLQHELRVQKGDRIAILSQNRLEFVVLLFAIAKLQCIAVPLNIRLNINELIYQLKDSGTTILFAEDVFYEMAVSLEEETGVTTLPIEKLTSLKDYKELPSIEIDEEAPYIICYTSGTTGKPKGAVLTQRNMFWNALNNSLAIDLNSKDKTLVTLPLFHIGGIGLFAFPTLFVGGTIVIQHRFEPYRTIELIEKHKVTVFFGVPTIHQAVIECPAFDQADLSSIRWFYSGGAPCPLELIQAYFDRGFLFGQGFGMTETSPTMFMLSEEDAIRKMGSIGKPAFYCEIKLVDSEGTEVNPGEVGHLLVRGPHVMKEYWNRPDATEEAMKDGWFHTGDLAQMDDEGFVYIVGRKKEMIISGGENIYPLEVEQIINQLPEVHEVAVVGNVDPKWGEVPIAFIVKKEDAQLNEQKVKDYCKQNFAKYKVPKEVYFVEELPKNATGKIQKNQLVSFIKQVKQS